MNIYVHTALFVRDVGGGYTKAAVVGVNLTGQNDYGLEEDDCRNPDLVYVNVHLEADGGGLGWLRPRQRCSSPRSKSLARSSLAACSLRTPS